MFRGIQEEEGLVAQTALDMGPYRKRFDPDDFENCRVYLFRSPLYPETDKEEIEGGEFVPFRELPGFFDNKQLMPECKDLFPRLQIYTSYSFTEQYSCHLLRNVVNPNYKQMLRGSEPI